MNETTVSIIAVDRLRSTHWRPLPEPPDMGDTT